MSYTTTTVPVVWQRFCPGELRSAYGVEERYVQGFGGEAWEKEPLGRPMRGWEDNIKMDFQEVGWGAWTGLIWFRIRTGGGLF